MGRSEIRGGRRVFREETPVRAKVYTIGGFSVHTDGEQLLAWHGKTGGPHTTYLVHGEEDVMQRFATRLKGTKVVMPELHTEFPL
ncbi:MAG: hypothetical protein L3J88_12150 [Gammaproteobacteria bacterium]|nr:hypothetical protein [Gammaproteobacteria bacterium]MCF6364068.1 hypothetical protein [Gammaproteobacteria bacterium]